MDRRHFLTLAASAGVGAVLSPGQGVAGVSCYPVHSAKHACVAGLSDTPPIDPQPCRALSWATCLCYILRGYGAHVCEDTVLARYGAAPGCAPQAGSDLARLLGAAGTWRDKYGRAFLVQTERLPDFGGGHLTMARARPIITRLSRQPIFSGAAGHTTLLTEFTYDDGAMTKLKVTGATVRDPAAPGAFLRPLTPDELAAPSFLVALRVRAV